MCIRSLCEFFFSTLKEETTWYIQHFSRARIIQFFFWCLFLFSIYCSLDGSVVFCFGRLFVRLFASLLAVWSRTLFVDFFCLLLIPFCWFGSLHFIVIIWLFFKLKHIHKFLFLSYIFTSFPADYCLSCCLFFKRKKNRLELKVVGSCVAITGYSMQILERMNSMSQHQH